MKKYEVVWTELSDGSVRCHANNDGFSGMEILSLLEVKRDDVRHSCITIRSSQGLFLT